MVSKKSSPAAMLGNSKSKSLYSNSTSSQRARILEYFSKCPRLSTMKARDELGVLHPCGRVLELRRLGYRIDTLWVRESDNNGVPHRVGLYIFHGIDWAVLEKRLLVTYNLSNLSLDQRYELLKAEIAKRHLMSKQYDAQIKSLCKFLNY